MRVEVADLRKRFGKVNALDGVSFDFGSGQIWGFVGPNGAGKTTTMRILATLDLPDGGDCRVDGVSVQEYPDRVRRLVGFMPDTLPALSDISVHDYLDFFARAFGLRTPRRQQVLASLEEFTGLAELRHKDVATLSKGMKQRVSVARALVHDPPVLILDEPAAGLDPRARVELRELLRLLAAQGKAILVSSHILGELGEICDGTVIIENGRVLRNGTLREVLDDSGARRVVFIRPLDRLEEVHRFLLERPETDAVQATPRGLELVTRGGDAACAGLLADLVAAGFAIVEYGPRASDLEAAFLRLTRSEAAS